MLMFEGHNWVQPDLCPYLCLPKENAMAKSQKKSSREVRKPKAEKPKKQNASNPSTKGSPAGLGVKS